MLHIPRSVGFTVSFREVDERTRKYGENIYDIPLPDFWELFQDFAVSIGIQVWRLWEVAGTKVRCCFCRKGEITS